MLELYLTQNQNSHSDAYGKWYPRVSYKQTLNIHDMAVHRVVTKVARRAATAAHKAATRIRGLASH